MISNLRKLAYDYQTAKNSLNDELARNTAVTRSIQDLQKAKDYRATLLADFILDNMEQIIRK